MMKLKDQDWIDDVIKQHKKQLEEIKKNRTIEEENEIGILKTSEEIGNPLNSLQNSEENLFKNNLESREMSGNYMQIRENYSLENPYYFQNRDVANTINTSTKYESKEPHHFAYSNNLNTINTANEKKYQFKSQTIPSNNDLDRYKSYESYQSTNHTFSKEDDLSTINALKAKLETKKLRMREMKKNYESILEENAHLKFKLKEMEKYKSSYSEILNGYEQVNNVKSSDFKVDRERDFVNTIDRLEHDKKLIEEKLSKMTSLDKLKNQEIELMNQKIRDFELILDENQNEYIESIKGIKLELENYRKKHIEYEKFLDIMNYFFKKMQTYYNSLKKNKSQVGVKENNDDESSNYQNINLTDPKILQNYLIELENFIVKLLNEKSAINQKYSKILDIQSKIAQSESLDNSLVHIENVKKLNEQIFDLSEENKNLKHQLEESRCEAKSIKSYDSDLKKTDKENIFRNNYIKDQTRKRNHPIKSLIDTSNIIQNENFYKGEHELIDQRDESLLSPNNPEKNYLQSIDQSFAYKTLEQRVQELENELKLREKTRDTYNRLYVDKVQGQLVNEHRRSKSVVKKISSSSERMLRNLSGVKNRDNKDSYSNNNMHLNKINERFSHGESSSNQNNNSQLKSKIKKKKIKTKQDDSKIGQSSTPATGGKNKKIEKQGKGTNNLHNSNQVTPKINLKHK